MTERLCRKPLRHFWPGFNPACVLPFGHEGKCAMERQYTQAEFDAEVARSRAAACPPPESSRAG